MKLYPIWNSFSHGPACDSSDIYTWCAEGQCPSIIISFEDLEGLREKLNDLGLTEIVQYLTNATEGSQ